MQPVVLRFAAIGSILLLAACATPNPAPRDGIGAAYAVTEPDTVVSATYGWSQGGRLVRVVMCTPAHATRAPLLIYLPGLGESSDAALRWRTAWASAGYAVMSLQALDEDAGAWSSDLARAGDFKALGRQRYADAEMARRVQTIAGVVGDARRRAAAGDAMWRGVDWSRVAIAGFDLGASTALTIAAGPAGDAAAGAIGGLPVRAVIALSPLAQAAAGAPDPGGAVPRSAVLNVTSDADADPLGIVNGAHVHRAAFDLMPGSDKFLLSLQGPTHADLGDIAASKPSHPSSASAKPVADSAPRRRRGKRDSTVDAPTRSSDGADDRDVAVTLSPAALQSRMAAAQTVSIAFLDAYVKDAPRARQWLDSAAAQWLAPAGELLRK